MTSPIITENNKLISIFVAGMKTSEEKRKVKQEAESKPASKCLQNQKSKIM